MSDPRNIIRRFPKDENPDRWSPEYEYDYRMKEIDRKVERAVARAWKPRMMRIWGFGDVIMQERWDRIFGSKT